MNPDITNVVLALAALIGVATGAIGIFVTRLEYRDALRRVAKLEDRFDEFTGGPGYQPHESR
jgi:hypothetical protein